MSTEPTGTTSYTEDYGRGRAGAAAQPATGPVSDPAERTLLDPAAGWRTVERAPQPIPPVQDHGPARGTRTWSTTTVVLWAVVGILVGMITALLLLPDEDPVVLGDPAQSVAQADALFDAQQEIDRLNGVVAERDALLEELRAQLAASAAEGDAAAADVAARESAVAAREAEQDDRAAALEAREADVERREQEVAAREQAADDAGQGSGDTGIGDLDLPADLTLPNGEDLPLPDIQLPDAEETRNALERLVDRLQGIFGLD